MGGTVHGVVNKTFPRIVDNDYQNSGCVFAAFAQFFDHLSTPAGGSIMTRIASNYGGGSGFDYPGGSNPFGTGNVKLLGVWKMNTSTLRPGGGTALGEVYISLVASLSSSSSSYFSTWGLLSNDSGTGYGELAMQVAFREDGGDPWNVTRANLGADVPSNPVIWTAGGSTVHVLPRSNNPGGDHNTNKQNMSEMGMFYNFSILEGYFHGFADDDNFVCFYSSAAGLDSDPRTFASCGFGLGELRANAGADPYFCYNWIDKEPGFNRGTTYGDTAGSSDYQGGVKKPRSGVSGLQASDIMGGLDQDRSPNRYSVGGLVYDEVPVQIYEANGTLGYGHEPGGTDFWRFIYGVPNEALDAANKRVALGDTGLLSEKITVPWPDSIGEAPGATRTNDGVKF